MSSIKTNHTKQKLGEPTYFQHLCVANNKKMADNQSDFAMHFLWTRLINEPFLYCCSKQVCIIHM